MEDETKVEEVNTEEKKEEKKEKSKKQKTNVDINKLMGQAKDGVGSAKSGLSNFFEQDFKRAKLVLIALYAVQAILSFQAGLIFFIISIIVACIGYIGLNTIISDKNDSSEEDSE